ncbi:MAG: ABC transporter ATP-binding protein [Pseudomonadota bacterium]
MSARLDIEGVRLDFPVKGHDLRRAAARLGLAAPPPAIRALDGVSLSIAEGEVLGVVGESGCGKSTLARIVVGLLKPQAGAVRIDGQPLAYGERARRLRARTVQMVFQDPHASLNPRLTIADAIAGAPLHHGLIAARQKGDFAHRALAEVGLPSEAAQRYPHQFSGGQRQRIGIARALAMAPRLLILDEPVAALDVSVQAQILNLFQSLRETRALTAAFISHDLGVIRYVSDRVAVMYLGRIVEEAPAEALFAEPLHPYAQALAAEVDRFARGRRRYQPIAGEIPSPLAPPPGCAFHPRCPAAMTVCRKAAPSLVEVAPGRRVACHLHGEAALAPERARSAASSAAR